MALLGWENAVETAALTVSSSVTGMGPEMLRVPLGNAATALQTPAGTTSLTLTAALPSLAGWKLVALSRTNLTPAATLRVRVGAYDSGAVPAGVVAGVGQALHVLPDRVTGTTLQLDVADPGNGQGFLNIPLAFLGPAASFRFGYNSQANITPRSDTLQTRGGQEITTPLSSQRGWSFNIPQLPDSAAGFLDPLQAAAVARRNILYAPRPAHARAASEAVYGLLVPGPAGFVTGSGLLRSWQATITERL
jgi:hypothetical protein